jgi:hypothetical protein
VPEVVFLGSVLQRISPRITLLRTRLDPSWAKEQVTSSSDGAFDAFTIEQPTSRTRYGVNVRDRIFISLRKTGDVYEILGLPEEHRPYSYLRWEGNHLFVFDRWASPHHGIRYKLDARRKKILSARAFIEADYIERQKRVSRNR